MVLLKHDLKLEDADAISESLQALWNTLDFQNLHDEIENGGKAVNNRFIILQQALGALYADKKLTKAQIKGIMEYSRKTLFMHL